MSDKNVMRRLGHALRDGEKFDLKSGQAVKFLPEADDTGKMQVGDGTNDMDLEVYLGSSTEYVKFDVGNSRVDYEVPLRMSDGGTVTQASSITTGVTLSTLSGQITTVSSTLAAAGEATFTVTNTKVAATDAVIVNLASTSSAGTPLAFCSAVAAGSFDITIANLHASAALDNTMVINFVVIGGSSS